MLVFIFQSNQFRIFTRTPTLLLTGSICDRFFLPRLDVMTVQTFFPEEFTECLLAKPLSFEHHMKPLLWAPVFWSAFFLHPATFTKVLHPSVQTALGYTGFLGQ